MESRKAMRAKAGSLETPKTACGSNEGAARRFYSARVNSCGKSHREEKNPPGMKARVVLEGLGRD
jgi:hypothetical protein